MTHFKSGNSSVPISTYWYRNTRFIVMICLELQFLPMNTQDWCWSWNANTLATWCEELTHLQRPWCWERLKVGVNFLSVFYIAFQNFVYTSYFLNFISLIKELRLTAIWTVFPSLPGVYFLSWYFPSLLPWEFPLSFSCVYGSTVSCTLDPHSLFLVFWNSMWYFLVWVYFLFVLSSTWAFLIWKLMSFRPGTLLNYFLLISLASPSYLVFYYLSFIYLVFYCLSCGAFIIWSSCCGTLSSSICHIFFLWLL